MKEVLIPYGRAAVGFNIEGRRVKAVLNQHSGEIGDASPLAQGELVRAALQNPISSPRLEELAQKARRLLIITSDHTRPVPSKITLPLLLEEARNANPDVEVIILVATGMHRPSNPSEMEAKFGSDLLRSEHFEIHDCRSADMAFKGSLPSGGELWLNGLVDWADLIISEGFIEPHFFAGFSGGRKSVLPGIASEKTVRGNHCAAFIASERSRTGNLDCNPIHEDMLFAAEQVGLTFILNVAIDANKNIVAAFAGDPVRAHEKGCDYVGAMATVGAVEADIVITSNGGYPLDQNIYQAVKCMTAAEACVRQGGVIIVLAECEDGHGSDYFYRYFADARSAAEVAEFITRVPQGETGTDQWQAQVLARVLARARVIFVSGQSREMVEAMKLIYAENLEQAYEMALGFIGEQAETVIIPDGVGVVITPDI